MNKHFVIPKKITVRKNIQHQLIQILPDFYFPLPLVPGHESPGGEMPLLTIGLPGRLFNCLRPGSTGELFKGSHGRFQKLPVRGCIYFFKAMSPDLDFLPLRAFFYFDARFISINRQVVHFVKCRETNRLLKCFALEGSRCGTEFHFEHPGFRSDCMKEPTKTLFPGCYFHHGSGTIIGVIQTAA